MHKNVQLIRMLVQVTNQNLTENYRSAFIQTTSGSDMQHTIYINIFHTERSLCWNRITIVQVIKLWLFKELTCNYIVPSTHWLTDLLALFVGGLHCEVLVVLLVKYLRDVLEFHEQTLCGGISVFHRFVLIIVNLGGCGVCVWGRGCEVCECVRAGCVDGV